jgi:hypothetical protein
MENLETYLGQNPILAIVSGISSLVISFIDTLKSYFANTYINRKFV